MDPAGSKHVVNVYQTNDNTIILVIYYKFVDSCIIMLFITHNNMQSTETTFRQMVITGSWHIPLEAEESRHIRN
jgi:hypothetical protein